MIKSKYAPIVLTVCPGMVEESCRYCWVKSRAFFSGSMKDSESRLFKFVSGRSSFITWLLGDDAPSISTSTRLFCICKISEKYARSLSFIKIFLKLLCIAILVILFVFFIDNVFSPQIWSSHFETCFPYPRLNQQIWTWLSIHCLLQGSSGYQGSKV